MDFRRQTHVIKFLTRWHATCNEAISDSWHCFLCQHAATSLATPACSCHRPIVWQQGVMLTSNIASGMGGGDFDIVFGARRAGSSISVTTHLLGFSHTRATNTLLMREVRLELTGSYANLFNCTLRLRRAERHVRIHNTLRTPPTATSLFQIAFLICLTFWYAYWKWLSLSSHIINNMKYYPACRGRSHNIN